MIRALMLARDFVLTAVVVVVAAPVVLLPARAANALGRLYGLVLYFTWPVARRAALINLRRAYGSTMTIETARRVTRAVSMNMGQSIAEGIQFFRRFRGHDRKWESAYVAEDRELERRLLDDPRPKIFVTAHLGSWEVAAMILALRAGRRGAAVVRRVDNPFLNAIVRRIRLRLDSQWIEKRGAIEECLRRLRSGDHVMMLVDENGGRRGVFVPFFDRPASTQKTPALLALMTGAPIVVGAAVRLSAREPLLFRLALIETGRWAGAGPAAVAEITAEFTAVLERWIREDPQQWRWIHWRWRSRPEGTEETYRPADLKEAFGGAMHQKEGAFMVENPR